MKLTYILFTTMNCDDLYSSCDYSGICLPQIGLGIAIPIQGQNCRGEWTHQDRFSNAEYVCFNGTISMKFWLTETEYSDTFISNQSLRGKQLSKCSGDNIIRYIKKPVSKIRSPHINVCDNKSSDCAEILTTCVLKNTCASLDDYAAICVNKPSIPLSERGFSHIREDVGINAVDYTYKCNGNVLERSLVGMKIDQLQCTHNLHCVNGAGYCMGDGYYYYDGECKIFDKPSKSFKTINSALGQTLSFKECEDIPQLNLHMNQNFILLDNVKPYLVDDVCMVLNPNTLNLEQIKPVYKTVNCTEFVENKVQRFIVQKDACYFNGDEMVLHNKELIPSNDYGKLKSGENPCVERNHILFDYKRVEMDDSYPSNRFIDPKCRYMFNDGSCIVFGLLDEPGYIDRAILNQSTLKNNNEETYTLVVDGSKGNRGSDTESPKSHHMNTNTVIKYEGTTLTALKSNPQKDEEESTQDENSHEENNNLLIIHPISATNIPVKMNVDEMEKTDKNEKLPLIINSQESDGDGQSSFAIIPLIENVEDHGKKDINCDLVQPINGCTKDLDAILDNDLDESLDNQSHININEQDSNGANGQGISGNTEHKEESHNQVDKEMDCDLGIAINDCKKNVQNDESPDIDKSSSDLSNEGSYIYNDKATSSENNQTDNSRIVNEILPINPIIKKNEDEGTINNNNGNLEDNEKIASTANGKGHIVSDLKDRKPDGDNNENDSTSTNEIKEEDKIEGNDDDNLDQTFPITPPIKNNEDTIDDENVNQDINKIPSTEDEKNQIVSGLNDRQSGEDNDESSSDRNTDIEEEGNNNDDNLDRTFLITPAIENDANNVNRDINKIPSTENEKSQIVSGLNDQQLGEDNDESGSNENIEIKKEGNGNGDNLDQTFLIAPVIETDANKSIRNTNSNDENMNRDIDKIPFTGNEKSQIVSSLNDQQSGGDNDKSSLDENTEIEEKGNNNDDNLDQTFLITPAIENANKNISNANNENVNRDINKIPSTENEKSQIVSSLNDRQSGKDNDESDSDENTEIEKGENGNGDNLDQTFLITPAIEIDANKSISNANNNENRDIDKIPSTENEKSQIVSGLTDRQPDEDDDKSDSDENMEIEEKGNNDGDNGKATNCNKTHQSTKNHVKGIIANDERDCGIKVIEPSNEKNDIEETKSGQDGRIQNPMNFYEIIISYLSLFISAFVIF